MASFGQSADYGFGAPSEGGAHILEAIRICGICTFENTGARTICEMC